MYSAGKVEGINRPEDDGPPDESSVDVIARAREALGFDGQLGFRYGDEANKGKRGEGKRGSAGRRIPRGISVSDVAYEGLLLLAQEHGCFHGTHVSVSELIERIGRYRLVVTR